MDGLLIVDKPSGPTSHDVVARARRILQERRIGHTGTSIRWPAVSFRSSSVARPTRPLSGRRQTLRSGRPSGSSTDTYDARRACW